MRTAWVLGQPGMEPLLESELALTLGEAAFERPGGGLVRIRSSRELALDWAPALIFGRSYGLELDPEEPAPAGPVFMQVWKRRDGMPGARLDPAFERGRLRLESECRRKFEARGWTFRPAGEPPSVGERVLSVLWVAKDRIIYGHHLHGGDRLPYPGAEYPWPNQEIPSRAYVKAREVLEWTRAPISSGDSVLELGCAPGGASLALMELGARVVGVDLAPMNERFRESSARTSGTFEQRIKRAEEIVPGDLPERVDWLVSDMNVDASELLTWVRDWWRELKRRGLRGAILTVKAAREDFWASVPGLAARLGAELGDKRVVLKQLSQHRRELLCFIHGEDEVRGEACLPSSIRTRS